jgi:hypothetical protein
MLGTKTPALPRDSIAVTPAVFAAGVLRATVHGVCNTDSGFPKLGKSMRHWGISAARDICTAGDLVNPHRLSVAAGVFDEVILAIDHA